ncbi:MAG: LptA/OstA family protein [Myxococcota bacterium]|nr:LptA/OstA family protein [Myxococcota bacterium]
MTRRSLKVAMLSGLFCATAGAASGLLPSLLITHVEAAEADEGAALEFQRALRGAFDATGAFAIAETEALSGERTDERFRAWAEQFGADALLAASLADGSVRLELRSGHSGGLITDWSVEWADVDFEPIVREARLVLESQLNTETSAPDTSSAAKADSTDSVIGGLRSEGPIAIRSDELDVATRDGQRHLVFRNNVVVGHGDIELRARKLDAFYSEGDSEPERLVAHGEVVVYQADRIAYCDVATYLRSAQKIICKGHARVVQGCDIVRGEKLEFDLEREHFRVMGAASVLIGQSDERCPGDDAEAGL